MREFYELCQGYRHTPVDRLVEVAGAYEALIKFVNEAVASLKDRLDAKTCECRGWKASVAAVNAENTALRAEVEKWKTLHTSRTHQHVLEAENDRLKVNLASRQTMHDALASEIAILREALGKIADPRKRDHKEPDAYTELACVMHIANEALGSTND